MLELEVEFDRLRAVVGQKDSVKLFTNLKNMGTEPIAATLTVKFPFSLGLDAMGLNRNKQYRINLINPKEEKKITTELFLKTGVQEGYIPVSVKAEEHENNRFDRTKSSMEKELKLKVIKP